MLKDFEGSQVKVRTEWALHANFRLSVFKAAESRFEDIYVLGGTSDQDSGGWLMGLLEQSIRLCVAEKSQKILGVRDRYPEWWLLLVDHIGYGLSTFDRGCFRNRVRIAHGWGKICLISPLNPQCWFEI